MTHFDLKSDEAPMNLTDPAEPRGMTIADLVWLTVGVAVAASLGWYHL